MGLPGPASLVWAQFCPREPQGVGEKAGGAWGEAQCPPSVPMTGEQETHIGGRDRRKVQALRAWAWGRGGEGTGAEHPEGMAELGRAEP